MTTARITLSTPRTHFVLLHPLNTRNSRITSESTLPVEESFPFTFKLTVRHSNPVEPFTCEVIGPGPNGIVMMSLIDSEIFVLPAGNKMK